MAVALEVDGSLTMLLLAMKRKGDSGHSTVEGGLTNMKMTDKLFVI
jgi:hypothetical protein